MGLNERQIKFGWNVAAGMSQTQAYAAAYNCDEESANSNAHRVMALEGMAELIEDRRETLARVAGIDQNWVLRQCIDVIEADPRELIELRRGPCKECWKEVVDPALYEALGFNLKRDPCPSCERCDGEGWARVYAPDQRTISAKAARLLTGVKQTKDGVEIRMRDKDFAVKLVADYLGMKIERRELSGPGGGPMETRQTVRAEDMTDDEIAAHLAKQAG